jgi:hypothetical protein
MGVAHVVRSTNHQDYVGSHSILVDRTTASSGSCSFLGRDLHGYCCCWSYRLLLGQVMKDKEKEDKKLPKGTHVTETDAKNRKTIRELKRPSNEQDN